MEETGKLIAVALCYVLLVFVLPWLDRKRGEGG